MLFSGCNVILALIALGKSHPTAVEKDARETPILVAAPQKHDIPTTQSNSTGETESPHNAEEHGDKNITEENTLVFTEFADKTIEHDGTIFGFYKEFVNFQEINHRNIIRDLLELFHSRYCNTPTKPIIINNFNLNAALDYLKKHLNIGGLNELKDAQKHVKVLFEIIVVLEHLFIQTLNEYKKLVEDKEMKDAMDSEKKRPSFKKRDNTKGWVL
ncbi:hypothetical protein ENBRE01_1676 [Enteropsectra breve]|nr:hypothetical protein ENBRE01_1676 [Enteropsectra breve]